MSNIVFISELPLNEQMQWLSKLNSTLKIDSVKFPDELSDSEALEIDIAIVANPNVATLKRYPNLVWIQSLWAGVEGLVASNLPKHIKLVRLIDPLLAKTMAESVVAWTLFLQREMATYAKQQANNDWNQLPTISSSELRVSILGAGELGLSALTYLSKFDYQLSCWTRSPKNISNVKNYVGEEGLSNMLENTDILISLLPLTPQTHHILNKKSLKKLPKGAQVINFSRGAIIDTVSLIDLLNSNHLSHAVLDVFDLEPLPADSPLWQHENITILPHISAPTNLHTAAGIVVSNIERYRENNELPEITNLKIGY